MLCNYLKGQLVMVAVSRNVITWLWGFLFQFSFRKKQSMNSLKVLPIFENKAVGFYGV